MADIEGVKSLIKEQFGKDRDVMDSAFLRREVLLVLGDMPCPVGKKRENWEDWLEIYELAPDDKDRDSGLRIWAALRMYTAQNRYLITVLESLNPMDTGVYFATAHVSWREEERQRQERVDKGYKGQFDDSLRHRHMLWAQTFRKTEIRSALMSCLMAVLGHELTPDPPAGTSGEPLKHVVPQRTSFPLQQEEG